MPEVYYLCWVLLSLHLQEYNCEEKEEEEEDIIRY